MPITVNLIIEKFVPDDLAEGLTTSMASKSQSTDQIIPIPQGGEALKSIGEALSPDFYGGISTNPAENKFTKHIVTNGTRAPVDEWTIELPPIVVS